MESNDIVIEGFSVLSTFFLADQDVLSVEITVLGSVKSSEVLLGG